VAAQSSALNKGGSKQARRFYGGLFCRDSVLRSGATKPVIEITDENAGRPAESGRGPKAQDKRWEKAKKRGASERSGSASTAAFPQFTAMRERTTTVGDYSQKLFRTILSVLESQPQPFRPVQSVLSPKKGIQQSDSTYL